MGLRPAIVFCDRPTPGVTGPTVEAVSAYNDLHVARISKRGRAVHLLRLVRTNHPRPRPPQCLFGDVPTSELIAVPGCLTCNNVFARDDAFLRDRIVTATLHVDMLELAAPRAALRRSLTRPKHAGPIKRMLKGATAAYAPLTSPILQPVRALPVDPGACRTLYSELSGGCSFMRLGDASLPITSLPWPTHDS